MFVFFEVCLFVLFFMFDMVCQKVCVVEDVWNMCDL